MTVPTHKMRARKDWTSNPPRSLQDEVLHGLRSSPKRLPPKLFYDAKGARLFDKITTADEYYPTRTELEILASCAPQIAERAGPGAVLIEYGSGAGTKIRLLLDALDSPTAYIPIDISGEQLQLVSESLRADYPAVTIKPVRADYTRPIPLPKIPDDKRRVAFFPGSTIGNFEPANAANFLAGIRTTVGKNGALVLGVDRRKNPTVLERAYNDDNGVTAEFNKNVLVRMNRELGADFEVDRFRHLAFFNEEESRIEMHLESLRDQVIKVADAKIDFVAGETIWTESSYKYDLPRLGALAEKAGFNIVELWTDQDDKFWVGFLE